MGWELLMLIVELSGMAETVPWSHQLLDVTVRITNF